MCPRPCKADSDCGSKRQCLCDGQCGLSCVAPGNYLYACVLSVLTLKSIVGSAIKRVCVCVYVRANAYAYAAVPTYISVCVFLDGK